jgi:hypothetical protein
MQVSIYCRLGQGRICAWPKDPGFVSIEFSPPTSYESSVIMNVYHKPHDSEKVLLVSRHMATDEIRKLAEALKALLA